MRIRKIMALLLAISVSCGLVLPGTAVSAEDAAVFHVWDEKDFQRLAGYCALDSWSEGLTVRLEADLDFGGEDITPIPSFSGTFLGAGHRISGMTLSTDGSNQALFRYVTEKGEISNLKVEGEVVPSYGRDYIGGIAGTNRGIVENCSFRGRISGRNYVGGIVGENHGTVSNCRFSGSVDGKRFTGGIAGYNDGLIRDCRNDGDVNITVSEGTMELADLATSSTGIALNLLSAEDENVVADSGGVVGFSKGIVLSCSNSGTVGYPHYGYNVGGIAGRQSGFLSECRNTGAVYGKKDVAGIVGQMEPHLDLVKSTNLADELLLLNKYMNNASADISYLAEDFRDLQDEIEAERRSEQGPVHGGGQIYHSDEPIPVGSSGEQNSDSGSISGSDGSSSDGTISDAASEIADSAKGTIEKKTDGTITGEDIDDALKKGSDAINNRINELAAKLGDVYGVFSESGGHLASDLKMANDQFSRVMLLMANAMNGAAQNDIFEDVSEELGETVTEGNVSENTNHAPVDGDNNVGGIAGSMGIEYEFDLEDSLIQIVGANGIISNTYNAACINSGNANYSEVTGRKDRIGGIVGDEESGTVIYGESYGGVSSSDGSYVGGIAGYSNTSIRDSYVLCTVNGTRYVGGIAGFGKNLVNNAAIIDTESKGAFVGAVAGWADMTAEENVSGNVFVHETLGGVDGISYTGRAEPVLYEDLVTEFNVPSAFSQVTLRFYADGELVEQLALNYGTDLDQARIPDVPAKQGYTGAWSEFDTERVRFSRDIEAVYTLNRSTMASDQTREDSPQSIILLEGSFVDSARLELTPYEGEGPALPDGNTEESWQIQILNTQEEDTGYTVRYLAPSDSRDGETVIYRLKNGEWEPVETERMGSYLVFPAEGDNIVFSAVTPAAERKLPIIPIAAGAGGMLLLVILLAAGSKRRKNRKHDEESKPQA